MKFIFFVSFFLFSVAGQAAKFSEIRHSRCMVEVQSNAAYDSDIVTKFRMMLPKYGYSFYVNESGRTASAARHLMVFQVQVSTAQHFDLNITGINNDGKFVFHFKNLHEGDLASILPLCYKEPVI